MNPLCQHLACLASEYFPSRDPNEELESADAAEGDPAMPDDAELLDVVDAEEV